jgi:hypothetical protein
MFKREFRVVKDCYHASFYDSYTGEENVKLKIIHYKNGNIAYYSDNDKIFYGLNMEHRFKNSKY